MTNAHRPRPIWGPADIGRIVVVACIVITMLSVAFIALKLGVRESASASLPAPVVSTPAPAKADQTAPATSTSKAPTLAKPLPTIEQADAKAPTAPTDPADLGVLVNKDHALEPISYVPKNLIRINGEQIRSDAGAALKRLIAAAAADGHSLSLRSGYRSAAYQEQLHEMYAAQSGQAAADRKSARPGHSEHQTGLAADVTSAQHPDLNAAFGETAAGQWIAEHATDYGFIVRFPQGQESVTGYMWEPWHLRYLGDKRTEQYVASGAKTLEEFYGQK